MRAACGPSTYRWSTSRACSPGSRWSSRGRSRLRADGCGWLAGRTGLQGFERARDGRLLPARGARRGLEPPGTAAEVVVDGGVAWLKSTGGLSAIQLGEEEGDPPRVVGHLPVQAAAVAAAAGRLHVLDGDRVLHTFDVTRPAAPVMVERFFVSTPPAEEPPEDRLPPLFVLGASATTLAIAEHVSGTGLWLRILPLGPRGGPAMGSGAGPAARHVLFSMTGRLVVQDENVWVADDNAGFHRYRFDPVEGPVLTGTWATGSSVLDLALLDDGVTLLVLDQRLGLLSLDVRDPHAPRELGRLDLQADALSFTTFGLVASGSRAWVLRVARLRPSSSSALEIDVGIADLPSEVGLVAPVPWSGDTSTLLQGYAAAPGRLVVAGGDAGLVILPARTADSVAPRPTRRSSATVTPEVTGTVLAPPTVGASATPTSTVVRPGPTRAVGPPGATEAPTSGAILALPWLGPGG